MISKRIIKNESSCPNRVSILSLNVAKNMLSRDLLECVIFMLSFYLSSEVKLSCRVLNSLPKTKLDRGSKIK